MRVPFLLRLSLPLASLAFAILLPARAAAQDDPLADGTQPTVEAHLPAVVMDGVPFDAWIVATDVPPGDSIVYTVRLPAGGGAPAGTVFRGYVQGRDSVALEDLQLSRDADPVILVETPGGTSRATVRLLPGWLSILPPIVAIALALLFREVVISLLAGIWLGALYTTGWNPLAALARTLDRYVIDALTDPGHAMILVFSLLLGGMVGIISRNGGTYGLVNAITRHAKGPIRGQLAAYVMGLVIFFDDYSNTLIVGPTMRPITDRLGISREKLSYIVDSTAAPVASIALISSWIGFEVGLIGDSIEALGLDYSAYLLFVETIPYRFYPILALVFVLWVILTDRDFGPMLKAELRVRREGKPIRDGARPASDFDADILNPVEGKPHRWINAVMPIAGVTLAVLLGLWWTGRQALISAGDPDLGLQKVFASADSNVTLLWAAFAGCAVALAMTLGQRLLSVGDTMAAWTAGVKAMLYACVILTLAWSLGEVTTDVHTAGYVVGLLTGNLDPRLLPVLVFLICAFISFATGTSWGTMAIMMPIVIPLSVALPAEAGLSPEATYTILLGGISSVLAGSVWGDHCSPISDTTILSSMASSSDHIDHVRTQMPYALCVGIVGMLVGDIPTAYGLSPWISLVVGSGILLALLYLIGQREDTHG
ncbi:MAG: Na+/H+ antiporter NhaC family protein [Gemmatimonadota bacterium]